MSAIRWSLLWSRATAIALPIYFVAHSSAMLGVFLVEGLIGIDARIYSAAATSWLQGGDPWAIAVDGFYFAAPPPTLLAFAPSVMLGETLSAVLWIAGGAAAAVIAVRALKLEWWWVFFPPVTNGVLAGNPDPVILALLLTRRDVLGAAASVLKVYAVVPIIGERRWRTLIACGIVLAVTIPLLPWGLYLNKLDEIITLLAEQSKGISAYGTLWVMLLAGVALVALGARLAGWLAVPAMWPSTQLHYSVLALPALAALRQHQIAVLVAAMLLSVDAVWLPPVAVGVLAIAVMWKRFRQASGDHRTAMTTRSTPHGH